MIRVLVGHVLDRLKELPAESVHCCVTSPPYYGLRDYGIEPQVWPDGWRGSLGLEPTPGLFIEHMVAVFGEVRRVLRADGTCWINIGDSYAEKQLLGMPWMLAFALREDGWWLRSEITWAKRAPMPESVTDRPTSATEKVFLLAKSERYFYDAEAVKEPSEYPGDERHLRTDNTIEFARPDNGSRARTANPTAANRNLRNWWLLGPEPFPEAHFATFPSEIPRRAILAGSSEKGVCPKCGAPWVRIVKKTFWPTNTSKKAGPFKGLDKSIGWDQEGCGVNDVETLGWHPGCLCVGDHPNLPPVPATVLDPFLGAGTTALVADQLQRDCIGIELNPEYAAMAERRLRADNSLFLQMAAD